MMVKLIVEQISRQTNKISIVFNVNDDATGCGDLVVDGVVKMVRRILEGGAWQQGQLCQ